MTRWLRPNPDEFWATVPFSSTVIFFLAVFFTFATLGIVPDIGRLGPLSIAEIAIGAFVAGAFAIAYAFSGINRMWWLFPILFVAQGMFYSFNPQIAPFRFLRRAPAGLDVVAASKRLVADAALMYALIVVAYVLFIVFFWREGSRYFKTYAEITLAKEIHQHLVPPLRTNTKGYEFSAISVPSGEVGGDLVDIIEQDDKWLAYLADVSGHGVSSGVMMAMVKAATRMKPGLDASIGELFANVNRLIHDVKKTNMFVTAAAVRSDGNGALEACLAGHHPILHYRSIEKDVAEISIPNVPLGMFAQMDFAARTIQLQTGDVLLLLTDGLTEAADKNGVELGLDGMKRIFTDNARKPLPDLQEIILDRVRGHGPQDDDRSLLLIKRK